MNQHTERYYGTDTPTHTGPHPDPIQGAIDGAVAAERERCAKIADAQIGAAERDRIAKGRKPNPFMPEEAMASIHDEERGETIAAQMIAAAIRKL